MNLKRIDGNLYLEMVRMGAERLAADRKEINDLNVFPIPDGDTGDNMYMTIDSGCAKAGAGENIAAVSKAVSEGMLFGARGNSGVILSRIFAGLSRGLEGHASVGPEEFVAALKCCVEDAYKAVSVPVEGTMLTVIREGVAAARGNSFESVFSTLCGAMEDSLAHTPELLDVLKNAGVVDSGGAGLVRIFRGMEAAVCGERASSGSGNTIPAAAEVNLDAFGPDCELEFGYCTEFLLRLQSSKVSLDSFDVQEICDYLNSAGESVVCFREGSIVKVHVHTRTPGDILNHCQKWGEFLTIKIENMTLQHHEKNRKRSAPRKKYATVTVATGAGLAETFREFGADCVIEGGQTMNPSAERFIEAFREVNADTVFVLPNNSNIILTAAQAASLYRDSRVVVIPTKTLGAGIITMGAVDFSQDPDTVLPEAEEIAASVTCGAVSRAVRDTEAAPKDGYVGFVGGEILCGSESRPEAVKSLADRMDTASYDVLMIFKGEDASAEEAEMLCADLQKAFPRVEIICRDGGQPVYDYLLILQ